MKTDPSQRYATPRALAGDVEHWLADEPVGAYAEPVTVRAKRWMRQHPSRVTAAAVLLLATVVGLAIGTAVLRRNNVLLAEARRRADDNAREAERQRQAADAMFRDAKNTVDTFLTRVSEEKLSEQPRLQPLRKELLGMALNYYLRFIKQRADDANVRKDLADAFTRAGQAYRDTYSGSDKNAGSKRGKELRVRGIALYEELVKDRPGDRELLVALAGSLRGLSGDHWADGEYAAGVQSADRAVQVCEQLRAEDPSNVNFVRMLGNSYSWKALVEKFMGDEGGRAADTRRAVEIFQNILREVPDDEVTLSALASAYRRSARLDDVLEAVRISRQLVDSGNSIAPSNGASLLQYAAMGREPVLLTNALNNVSATYVGDLGQPGKAEPLILECLELRRGEMKQNPDSNVAIADFANPAGNLGESRFL